MGEKHIPRERLMLYRRGWKHAASGAARDPKTEKDPDYVQGYSDGVAARVAADKKALKRFGISSEEAMSWILR